MTGPREAQLLEAVNTLLKARRTLVPIPDLPPELRPTSTEEIDFMQDKLIDSFGEVGGWKVGAGSLEATPACAPMPRAWIAPGGAVLASANHRFRGLEAEIAFLLKADLPPRAAPYSDEEVYAAVASCHPAIEILESGLENPVDPAVRMTKDADLQMHGGFIFGPAYPDWKSDPLRGRRLEHVRQPAAAAALAGQRGRGAYRRPACRPVDHHRQLDRVYAGNIRLRRRRALRTYRDGGRAL
jgi:2-keto-4-pentenoate hydratase